MDIKFPKSFVKGAKIEFIASNGKKYTCEIVLNKYSNRYFLKDTETEFGCKIFHDLNLPDQRFCNAILGYFHHGFFPESKTIKDLRTLVRHMKYVEEF